MEGVRIVKRFWLRADECTGCAACANACPTDAITMESDETGFSLPRIGASCIDCNKCETVCRNRHHLDRPVFDQPRVFAARSKDEEIRFASTSGGVFTELARVTLGKGGVVVGAAYDDQMNVYHTVIRDEEALARLRQSKYVQSEVGLVFREIKSLLADGTDVLFCGAPCQVAGLVSYLGGHRGNLLLIDFVCHGVNSPKAYRAWLDELARDRGSDITRVWFKYKEGGWKSSPLRTRIEFADGGALVQDQRENLFMRGYLGPNLYLRPCCADCRFRGVPLYGDVTLADFWGLDPAIDDDRGTSLVMVNTARGQEMLGEARGRLTVEERGIAEAIAGNASITSSPTAHPRTREFLRELGTKPFSRAILPYLRYHKWRARIRGVARRMRGLATVLRGRRA